ncbi:LexA family protein [Labrys sp. La1]|uniref:LexA family protein n=1 Tax=Labrys sp. La1 TaxID=3404917 RepID=UPI003EC0E461
MREALLKIMDMKGWKQDELARQLGVSQPSISRWMKGADPRGAARDKIREILNGDRITIGSTVGEDVAVRSVPVMGQVGAGVWFDEGEVDESVYSDIPVIPGRYAAIQQSAYRVTGDSVDKLGISDGSYVITIEYWMVRAAIQDGDVVVVEKREGGKIERTVKVVVVTPTDFRLEARSNNPKWDGVAIVIPRKAADFADDREIVIVGLVIGDYRVRA